MTHALQLLCVLLILGAPSYSAGLEMFTLERAVRTAIAENPSLRSRFRAVDTQREELNAAKGRLYPRITVEETYQRTNNPTYGFMAKLNQERFSQQDFLIERLNDPDDISDIQTSLTFEQPLFVPKAYMGIDISSGELKTRQAEYERAKDRVVLDVVKKYLAVQTALKRLETARLAIKDAAEHKRLASLRYETGTGLYSDVLRAKVAVKKAESAEVMAESGLAIARRALGLTLGRTEPVDVYSDKPVLTLSDIDVYLRAAGEREDLKALHLRRETSRKTVKLEKSSFLPEIGIGGSYNLHDHREVFGSEGESYMFMGFVRWNLFDASSFYRIRAAKSRTREIEEKLSGLEKEIHFRINEAYTTVHEKEQKLTLAKEVLAEAREAMRLVRIRYENSLAPIVDLLDTELMLDSARTGVVEAENEYLNSVVHLYYQSGILQEALAGSYDTTGGRTDD